MVRTLMKNGSRDLQLLFSFCFNNSNACNFLQENILLDGDFRALVSDFGLSKLKGRDESRVETTTIRGTRGYIAPEWLLENGISEKCDVYSYGMVVLEMIGGRRCITVLEQGHHSKKKFQFFPRIVVEKLKEGKLMEVVDDRLLVEGAAKVDERELRRIQSISTKNIMFNDYNTLSRFFTIKNMFILFKKLIKYQPQDL